VGGRQGRAPIASSSTAAFIQQRIHHVYRWQRAPRSRAVRRTAATDRSSQSTLSMSRVRAWAAWPECIRLLEALSEALLVSDWRDRVALDVLQLPRLIMGVV